MKVHILGSGAGGGFPQWNCYCHNCDGFRKGKLHAKARTQSSIAISDKVGTNWILINASPDIRAQLLNAQALQPARKVRDSAIDGVILVDSQIDHTTGLLMLREGNKLPLYCTQSVYEDLTTGFPIINILASYCGTEFHEIKMGASNAFNIPSLPHIRFIAIALEGKAPPYSPHRQSPTVGDNIALFIHCEHSNKSLFYAPGLAKIDEVIFPWMQQADCLLLDGTFWQEDEMKVNDIADKPAASMGHLLQSGANGMINHLNKLPDKRKILIHINNTNPILDEDSAQRKELSQAGIEVAEDGMVISL
ncbi:MAG: pyrroloquinoline quinone biosynthesis protein PqqB [Proteobacteria bacterium]|nr:pyrroloquinoline quinone biosynthesis protein PqqB [Pseudomonadota bacterium]